MHTAYWSMTTRSWLRRLALAVAICGAAAGASLAQVVLAPLPSDALIDVNGVDLAAGQFEYSTTDLTIGDPANGGLEYKRYYATGGGRDNFTFVALNARWKTTSIYRMGWAVGDASYSYSTLTATTLTENPSGTSSAFVGDTIEYTAPDGTVYVRSYDDDGAYVWANGAPTWRLLEIRRPNGEIVTLNWLMGNFKAPRPEGDGYITGRAYRLSSVTNNRGYRLQFEYQTNVSFNSSVDQWQLWSHVTKVTGINLAVENCAATCTQPWPTVTYTPITFANSSYTKTDAAGAQTYLGTSLGRLRNIRFPERTTGYDIQIATKSFNLNHEWEDGDEEPVTATVTTETGVWTYDYADVGDNRTVTVTDPLGDERSYTSYVPTGRLLSATDELGHTTSYTYDVYGRLASVTLPEGNGESYTYDARGNMTEKRQFAKPSSTLDDIVWSATYPATCTNRLICNRPTSTTGPRGQITNYTYSATHGGLLTARAPAPTTGAVRPEQRITYTALNAWYKNSAGTVVEDANAIYLPTRTSQCVSAAACAAAATEVIAATTYGVDGVANNLLPTSVSAGSGNGSLTATATNAYDAWGNLSSVNGPVAGDDIYYRYDAMRRRIGTITPDPDGAGPLPYRAVRTLYDLEGQVTATQAGTVTAPTSAGWTGFSLINQTTFEYDDAGRKIREAFLAGATTYRLTQYSYDVRNRLICTAVRMNSAAFASAPAACTLGTGGSAGPDRISRNTWDDASRLLQVTSALGTPLQQNTITSTYTNNDKELTVIDAKGNRTTYVYDGYDRLSRTRYPTASNGTVSSTTDYEERTYDAASNLTLLRRRDGQNVTYAYDFLNRLTTDIDGVTYTYDNLDRRLTATRSGQVVTTAWDALGRMTSETTALGAVEYQYDLASRRTRLTWPDDFYVTYSYDSASQPTAIRESGATSGVGVLATFTYDNLGRRTGLTRGNGVVSTWGYNAAAMLSTLSHNLSGTVSDQTWTFGRNVAGQILSSAGTNAAYDHPAPAAASVVSSPNGLNQIAASAGVTYTYDLRGNLTSNGVKTFAYDIANRLTSGTGLTLAYDPTGRLSQTVGATTTRFAYDGVNLIGEYSSAGVLQRRYVHSLGTDEPLVWYEGAGTTDRRWLAADNIGSIVSVSNAAGASIDINTYDEYGVPAAGNLGRFGYTGQIWLPELQLFHYKSRAYWPALGRFLQTDPTGYADGLNVYRYVANDPVNATDPTGMQTATCTNCYGEIVVGNAFTGAEWFRVPIPRDVMVDYIAGRITETVSDVEGAIRGETRSEARSRGPEPLADGTGGLGDAQGRPHSTTGDYGGRGYTEFGPNDPVTGRPTGSRQYRPAPGRPHGDVPRPNVKDRPATPRPDGTVRPGEPVVRPPREDEHRPPRRLEPQQ